MISLGRRGWLAVGALGVAAIGYVVFRPTDESKIRAQLSKLTAAVKVKESDAQSNPILRLARVSDTFQSLFEPDVRVSIPELTSMGSGRQKLEELTTAAPRYVRTLDVDLDSITIKLDDAHTSAEVEAVADVKAVEKDGAPQAGKRAVDLRFAKRDGEWIITTLTLWDKADARP